MLPEQKETTNHRLFRCQQQLFIFLYSPATVSLAQADDREETTDRGLPEDPSAQSSSPRLRHGSQVAVRVTKPLSLLLGVKLAATESNDLRLSQSTLKVVTRLQSI